MKYESLLAKVKKSKTKFIVITGGVCSSIGKGVLMSSIGTLLKNTSSTLSLIKMDPYLNVDPGTMSPLVHGEVFVLDDGSETDLDLGHYERTLQVRLTGDSSVSAGQIFHQIIEGERKGEFLGSCIQLVPHVVEAIKSKILSLSNKSNVDYILVEIGGTVGDMEGDVFLEAVRQLQLELGSRQIMFCHLSYVPYLKWANEIKTKPTQHSVMLLKKAGIVPDALFLRLDQKFNAGVARKLAVMCGVKEDMIFQVPTHDPIYELFIDLKEQQLHKKIQSFLGFRKIKSSSLKAWERLIAKIKKIKPRIHVGMVVKYIGTSEPYISVIEALKSASWHSGCDVEISLIDARKLEESDRPSLDLLKRVQGIVVPGGFDVSGVEGKIKAAKHAREKLVPYLGLCLGLQVMLIELARSLLGIKRAFSKEFDKSSKDDVITLLEEQHKVTYRGASMRLGLAPCYISKGSAAHKAYGKTLVYERHRHRYEFNNKYKSALEKKGVVFSGIYKEKNLVEIAELKDHPFMLGSQFHPELISSPLTPHPLFMAFIRAILSSM